MEDQVHDAWVVNVLQFWFEELEQDDWFRKNSAVDETIASRFADYPEAIHETPLEELVTSGERALASVIVLDQFPRNLYRGQDKAFAFDRYAREIAHAAIAAKRDQALSLDQRLFLYLPFEHSEDLADQERAVALIAELGSDQYTDYALAHKKVIERFNRFPHRNRALGRTSTPEEEAYLAEPGSGF